MKVRFGDYTIPQVFEIETDAPGPINIVDNRGHLLVISHPKGLEKYKIREVGHFKSHASEKPFEATRYTRSMERVG